MKRSCEEKCQWEIAYKSRGSLEWIDAIIISIIKDKSALCNRPKLKDKKKFNENLYNRCYKILNGPAQCIPPKIPGNTPPPPFNPLSGTYQVSKRNTLSYIAFANILIENQILRQSCIEPYTGTHQKIFLACGGMLRCRLQANRSLAEGRSHWRQSCKKQSFPCGSL